MKLFLTQTTVEKRELQALRYGRVQFIGDSCLQNMADVGTTSVIGRINWGFVAMYEIPNSLPGYNVLWPSSSNCQVIYDKIFCCSTLLKFIDICRVYFTGNPNKRDMFPPTHTQYCSTNIDSFPTQSMFRWCFLFVNFMTKWYLTSIELLKSYIM